MQFSRWYSRIHPYAIFTLFLILTAAQLPAANNPAAYLTGVMVNPTMFDLTVEGMVRVSFTLDRPARANVTIHDSSHALVRRLAHDKPCFPGLNTILWDGRDDAGSCVPAEAYYPTIVCVDEKGNTASYDPPMVSGGERQIMSAEDVLYDPEAGGVAYTLKTPSRVLLRAGLRDGPLLKTLINWAPRPAGTHREPWDGKDESGVVDAAKMNGFMIICRAAALPENSIIVTASSSPDSQSAGRDIQTDDRRKAVIAALSSRDKAIEPAAWLPRKNIRTPVFSLSAGNTAASESEAAEPPIPVLSGEAGLVVSLDAGTRTMMLEQRYEIILFVDGEMMGEVEQGYSPYTWVLDTTEFPDGEHLITVNVAGLNDQIGTQSMKIVISNGSSDK